MAADNDSVINNIEELLNIFSQYPEGTDIVTALSNKSSKDHTHTVTAKGSVSQPTFSGTQATISTTGTDKSIGVTISSSHPTSGTNYTPQGSIKINSITPAGSITGNADFTATTGATTATVVTPASGSHTHTVTAKGTISSAAPGSGETANYTPAGTISKPGVSTSNTASGTPSATTDVASTSHTHTVSGSVAISEVAVDATHAANYTPAGTVDAPTFAGTAGTVSVTGTTKGSISTTDTASGNTPTYTPKGSVSAPSLTHTATATSTPNTTNQSTSVPTAAHTHTVSGSVAISSAAPTTSNPKNYTPEGTVSKPTFSGTAATITVSGTPTGSVSAPTFTGTEGTVTVTGTTTGSNSAHSHTVTVKNGTKSLISAWSAGSLPSLGNPSTTDVYSITGVGSASKLDVDYDDDTETLTIAYTPSVVPTRSANPIKAITTQGTFSAGTLPSLTYSNADVITATTDSVTVKFNGASMTSTGTFTPAGTVGAPTFTGTKFNSTGSYTPAGSVSQPTFTGTDVYLSGSMSSGTAAKTSNTTSVASTSHTHNYDKATSVSAPTFTGKGSTFTFNGASMTSTGTFTPAGTVSAPTFTGTGAHLVGSMTEGTAAKTASTAATVASSSHTHQYAKATGLSEAPKFTGTGVMLKFAGSSATTGGPSATVNAAAQDHTHSVTTTVDFTKAGFSGTAVTPTGSFTGTPAKFVGLFNSNTISTSGTYTPAGTVSKPTFTGESATTSEASK